MIKWKKLRIRKKGRQIRFKSKGLRIAGASSYQRPIACADGRMGLVARNRRIAWESNDLTARAVHRHREQRQLPWTDWGAKDVEPNVCVAELVSDSMHNLYIGGRGSTDLLQNRQYFIIGSFVVSFHGALPFFLLLWCKMVAFVNVWLKRHK